LHGIGAQEERMLGMNQVKPQAGEILTDPQGEGEWKDVAMVGGGAKGGETKDVPSPITISLIAGSENIHPMAPSTKLRGEAFYRKTQAVHQGAVIASEYPDIHLVHCSRLTVMIGSLFTVDGSR